jgi:molybdate transport repressor ModE-like protein
VISAQTGGTHGGGAALTAFGVRLIDQYHAKTARLLARDRRLFVFNPFFGS